MVLLEECCQRLDKSIVPWFFFKDYVKGKKKKVKRPHMAHTAEVIKYLLPDPL